MANPLFSPEVRHMLAEDNSAGLAEFCEALHPNTIAEALVDEFSVEDIWRVLRKTNVANQATIFEYFPLELQVEMVEGAGRPEMARLIEEMASDDRADLLRKLNPQVAEGLLRLVDEADRRDIATLVKYPEHTAGAIMTTDYAWLPNHITAGEAIERLRLQAPDTETIYYIYVVNDQRRLEGVVSLRDLILKSRTALIKDFMETQIVSVKATEDTEKVAAEIARYDLLAIPVVDDEGRLIGIVTHDDVIDVVVEEATEDVQRMGAVGPIAEHYLEAPFIKVWRQRAIWLAALFIAEMFTFNAMAYFDEAMKTVTVLALFVPLCISVGGNSGSQAAALITRALALGQANAQEWYKVLRHELLMGLALGGTLGVIALVRTGLLYFYPELLQNHSPVPQTPLLLLTLVVGQAVAAICMWGTLIGSMLPLVFKSIGVDPGIASSPFVATFVDVTGIIIYFTIARVFLGEMMAMGAGG